MSRALELATRGEFSAHPNPRVGCVIARGGDVVGEGWHAVAGEDHAEIRALRAAGDGARGACAYVALEPCAHHGKTPPCAAALIAADVARVVVAMQDPFPEVGGRGLEALRDAGIRTEVGLLQDEAEALNAGFISRVVRGRPFLRLKIASSLDGATAMDSGESRWITGPAARADVQKLRARSGAVMTGVGTVLADDPSLDVRDDQLATRGLQPLRVVLDSRLRMPLSATMLYLPGATLVCCTAGHDATGLRDARAEVAELGAHDGHVHVFEELAALAEREDNDVLVEAGPRLAGYLLEQRLVDELGMYQAPHIMGSNTRRMFETPAGTVLGDRLALDVLEVCDVGGDTKITARPTG